MQRGDTGGNLCRAGGSSSQLVKQNLTLSTIQLNALAANNFATVDIILLLVIV